MPKPQSDHNSKKQLPLSPALLNQPARLNMEIIGETLQKVEEDWPNIETNLALAGVGKKDVPFNALVRENMLSGYLYVDQLLEMRVSPLSMDSLGYLLGLNNRVHYGQDEVLMAQYQQAIEANTQKFYEQIEPIVNWYQRHHDKNKIRKLAGEIYVTVLSPPQLFIEGNHRTGSLIASWINVYHGYPPFVLSPENAVGYFQPSSEIKRFVNKAVWRGRNKLPKYRKSFGRLWETLTTNWDYLG